MDHEKQGATYPQGAHELQNQQPPQYHQTTAANSDFPPPGHPQYNAAQHQYQSSPPLSTQPTGASQGQYFPPQNQQPGIPNGAPMPAHSVSPGPHPVGSGPPPTGPANAATAGAASGRQQFQNATAIANLGRGPAPVDCPACGTRNMTTISHHVGNSTHAWALGLCVCLCLGCIPYLISSLKDVEHKCGRCGVLLATWHRSGSTEVHIHS